MKVLHMIRKLLSLRQERKEATARLVEACERRKPVVAPIRKKIEQRERESAEEFVANGNGC